LPAAELEHELRSSLDTLRAHLARPLPLFAYPKGAYSPELIQRVRAAGYVAALTTDEGPNHDAIDMFAIRRTLVGDEPNLATFAARVTGLAAWVKGILRKPTGSHAEGRFQ
jgi:peptidoglycan/xylan/chitin deacetylase (PgdA/CDA1 family)